MALSNFTELKASIIAWSSSTELTAVIDDLVTLAEVRIYEKLRAKSLTKDLSLAYVATNSSVTLPADCISVLSLRDTNTTRSGKVEVIGTDKFTDSQSSPITLDTTKTQVLVTGRELIFVTARTDSGTIVGRYFAKEPALSVGNPTNVILTNYPMLYLFGGLIEAFSYLMDEEAATKYEVRFGQAMDAANSQNAYLGQRQHIEPSMTIV